MAVVNSHNEWDPLEEVIVGNPENAFCNYMDPYDKLLSEEKRNAFVSVLPPGALYPAEVIRAAKRDIDEFVHILQSEGVIVRRPELVDYDQPITTPDWHTPNGFSAANPRDIFLVLGNEILETPTSQRTRYFEARAYRNLLMEYFRAGMKWTSAPRPLLQDPLYDADYIKNGRAFMLTEAEPVFDAADFVRCGRDIVGQLSHVTNQSGVDWLQQHLGDRYRIHMIHNRDPHAVHIDSAIMPLAPGKLLVNPVFVDVKALPSMFRTWDILVAPDPVPYRVQPKIMSDWISINMLVLDEKRVVVEKRQEPLIRALKQWGFEPIPCPMENHYPFAGGFHCATLDIRRRGELQSYC
jgi:glycine amidinotransferase